jgi:uncharacterized protein YdcH (DUF465 family)
MEPSTRLTGVVSPESRPVSTELDDICSRLTAERRRIHDEIKVYPRPIPACDAQFNYLLEQRADLDAELNRLEEARQNSASVESIQQFLRSSPYLSDELKQRLGAFPSADTPVN